ncbi:MAG TPA: hypothetical protein VMB79_15665 [Jatrophihabitans sp.]|nr:hypothetical protein [Jatrophihabitans sp.]
MSGPYESAAALWQRLVSGGDLQVTGRDAELVVELRDALSLPPSGPVEPALAGRSAGDLIEALFQLSAPYLAMWQDLLLLFESAAATSNDNNLDIVYDFDRPEVFPFDLESFRRQLRVAGELVHTFRWAELDQSLLWNACEALGRGAEQPAPAIAGFCEAIRQGRYPAQLPPPPAVASVALRGALAELWQVASAVLDDLRAISAQYGEEPIAFGADRTTPSGMPYLQLAVLASDYWLAEAMLRAYATAGRPGFDPAATAAALRAALAPMRTERSAADRLLELLSLPLWKHRYDLYSNWVASRVLAALADQEPIVHCADGTLVFAFSGTHLATLAGLRPRTHLWLELKSPAGEFLRGAGRSKNVQPDIALRQDPLTAGRNPLIVECKQYARANHAAFADALTDYASAHPGAQVVLVNYGPGNPASVRGRVEASLVARTSFLPELRPDRPEALGRFAAQVRGALGLPALGLPAGGEGQPEPTDRTAGAVPPDGGASLTLTWGPLPLDLDLHLVIGTDDPTEVGYRERGTLTGFPFARLVNDDRNGNGHEVLEVARLLPTRYRVEVVNYSGEVPLGRSGARVVLELGGRSHVADCPPELTAERWCPFVLDGATGELTAGTG